MSRGNNLVRHLASQPHPRPRPPPQSTICLRCLHTLRHTPRSIPIRHASTATATSSPDPAPTPLPPPTPHTQTHTIHTALLLSRAPLLTRSLTPFESAYFLYQRRLNERLSLPFSRYFYYARGTPQEAAYKRSIRERLTPARDIGRYSGYGDVAWDDEVKVGDRTGEREEVVESLVRDAEGFLRKDKDEDEEGGEGEKEGEKERVEVTGGSRQKIGKEVPKPVERISDADRRGDERSLSRKMERTLYLLVQKNGVWGFPTSRLGPKESLHTAAERTLIQSAGLNMNTWIVGNWPVGHQILNYPQPRSDELAPSGFTTPSTPRQIIGQKTFFMKARILAGQADLKNNTLDLKDFKWLAKEEVQRVLDKREWNAVRWCLSER